MNSEPEELIAGGAVLGVTILGSPGGGPGLRRKLLGGGGIDGACDRAGIWLGKEVRREPWVSDLLCRMWVPLVLG